MRKPLVACVLIALTGCGANESPPKLAPTSVLVLGDSLTIHGIDASIGWYGNWGMAASSADKDFAHLLQSSLGVPMTPINIAIIAQDPDNATGTIQQVSSSIDAGTLVVIQLGALVTSADISDF